MPVEEMSVEAEYWPLIYIAYGPPRSGKSSALEALSRLEAPSFSVEFSEFVSVAATARRVGAHRQTLLLFRTEVASEQDAIFDFFGHLFVNRETFRSQMSALEPYSCFRIENNNSNFSIWHVPSPFIVEVEMTDLTTTGAA